jgi:gamma-glutamylcyclotransferase (GGCT)/AIG2-like uncharacterized protein YtfP
MLLFVYGSLKKNGHYFSLIEKEVKLINDDCYTKGMLVSLGKYPALIDGNGMVHGELFEITNEGLRICDEIEGYSSLKEINKNLYYREERDIFSLPERSLIGSAIVYILSFTEMSLEWKNKTAKIEINTN